MAHRKMQPDVDGSGSHNDEGQSKVRMIHEAIWGSETHALATITAARGMIQ